MSDQDAIKEIIFTLIGEASMCWETPFNGGVFETERANKIGHEAVVRLQPFMKSQMKRRIERKKGSESTVCEIKDLIRGDLFRILDEDYEERRWLEATNEPTKNSDGVWNVEYRVFTEEELL